MTEIDVEAINRAMQSLPDVLEHEELAVMRSLPRLPPADVLDTALRRALNKLRFELNQTTFEYLRWKVALTRAENERLRAAAALGRDRATSPAAATLVRHLTEHREPSRVFKDQDGVVWTAAVIHTVTASDPAPVSCLVFSSEDAVAYRWQFPPNWFELSDRSLDELRLGR